MKLKKMYLKYLLYYVFGDIIFNIVFSIINTMFTNLIGGEEKFIKNLLLSFRETFIIYTLVFIGIVLVNTIYKKNTINQLNKKLNKIREGSGENEK